MNIAMIGTGYVGLVSGTCFAEMGNHVICVDADSAKVESMSQGKSPIHELGLEDLMRRNLAEGRLLFTTSIEATVDTADVFFIAVGTNPVEDGSADLSQVEAVARDLGRFLQRRALVINKSTVPVGTGELVESIISEELEKRSANIDFEVASNPEFLKEGVAVEDFMRPDRVIVGTDSEWAREVMHELYRSFSYKTDRILFMGRRDAEMAKYAANAMLATRISFMNEIANLCERLEVDVEQVRLGIGSDPRIGYSFIYPGVGYGGSCFPKDVRALVHMAESAGFEPLVLPAVQERNARQKHRLNERVQERFGDDLSGLRFGVWGLSFKPGTDDMRGAPSLVVIQYLLEHGAEVVAYDPCAIDAAKKLLPHAVQESGQLRFAGQPYQACEQVDALLLVTEWKPFRHPDFQHMSQLMRQQVIFDGRNQYEPEQMREYGFEYIGIGRRA